jgi:leader peptidase (prepilin peptidase)/N-methyltransferase
MNAAIFTQPWFVGLLGLIVGSFLNVCIYRLPRDINIAFPGSFCPHCKTPIRWFHNIPVLSFILLRGKCAYCGTPIPLLYPLVEVLTAAIFFYAAWLSPEPLRLLQTLVFASSMIALFFADLETRLLPNTFTYGGMIVGIAFSLFVYLDQGLFYMLLSNRIGERMASLTESLGAAFFLSGIMWVVAALYYRLRKREGLGLGDVKMLAATGAFLGFQGNLFALLIASIGGTLIGVAYMWITKKSFEDYELPMGTFIAFAALVVCFLQLQWRMQSGI